MTTIESYVPEMHADNMYVVMDTRTAVVPDNGIMDKPCKMVIRSTRKIKLRCYERDGDIEKFTSL